jgi:hypothetical protein
VHTGNIPFISNNELLSIEETFDGSRRTEAISLTSSSGEVAFAARFMSMTQERSEGGISRIKTLAGNRQGVLMIW